jgi:hypothetical protein
MKLREAFRKLKNPAVLMGVMMGAQAVAEISKKALDDGKLTLGEAIDIIKKTTEVTGLSNAVIYRTDREN